MLAALLPCQMIGKKFPVFGNCLFVIATSTIFSTCHLFLVKMNEQNRKKQTLLKTCQSMISSAEFITKMAKLYHTELLSNDELDLIDKRAYSILKIFNSTLSMFCSHSETYIRNLIDISDIKEKPIYGVLLKHINVYRESKEKKTVLDKGTQTELEVKEEKYLFGTYGKCSVSTQTYKKEDTDIDEKKLSNEIQWKKSNSDKDDQSITEGNYELIMAKQPNGKYLFID